jgi:integrase
MKIQYLTHEEVTRLLDACRVISPDLEDLIRLALHTGMRRRALYLMTWEGDSNVDFIAGLITYKRKGRGYDTVEMDDTAREILTRRSKLRTGSDPKVWKWGYDRMYRLFKQAARASLDRNVTFHILRHTCLTWLADTQPIHVVQAVAGHRNIQTTAKYMHVRPGQQREALNGLPF